MTPRELAEYRALRATIRERGTARVWILFAGFVAWGGLATATAALAAWPIATLIPLLVLATGFEVVFGLHTGLERVGRYIQLFFEEQDGWEHRAMSYAQKFRPGAGDPLMAPYFAIATVFNLIPAAMAYPAPVEWSFLALLHLLFLFRIELARRQSARQRAVDLERFQSLKQPQ